MRKWIILSSLLLLTACVSPAQRDAARAAQDRADQAECVSIGFTPNTEGMANCLLKLKEIRAQEANTEELRRSNNTPMWGPWGPWGPYGPPYRY
tara:strand:- start:4744 stop:5025 length:282 start_codon:yes stop_codon:yes gene_type:complete